MSLKSTQDTENTTVIVFCARLSFFRKQIMSTLYSYKAASGLPSRVLSDLHLLQSSNSVQSGAPKTVMGMY